MLRCVVVLLALVAGAQGQDNLPPYTCKDLPLCPSGQLCQVNYVIHHAKGGTSGLAITVYTDHAADMVPDCPPRDKWHNPEPMDVSAVEEEYVAYQTHENCRSASDDPACHTESYDVTAPASCYLMQCDTVDHKENRYTCADKRRVLLTDEAGGKHCILFPGKEEE